MKNLFYPLLFSMFSFSAIAQNFNMEITLSSEQSMKNAEVFDQSGADLSSEMSEMPITTIEKYFANYNKVNNSIILNRRTRETTVFGQTTFSDSDNSAKELENLPDDLKEKLQDKSLEMIGKLLKWQQGQGETNQNNLWNELLSHIPIFDEIKLFQFHHIPKQGDTKKINISKNTGFEIIYGSQKTKKNKTTLEFEAKYLDPNIGIVVSDTILNPFDDKISISQTKVNEIKMKGKLTINTSTRTVEKMNYTYTKQQEIGKGQTQLMSPETIIKEIEIEFKTN